ncbi:cellulase family glycosylhydrolase [Vallicoccus soli]|uniref:Glycoside hydrolase family 5 domain-containing protein n=1 Tax=Vallicoccus soli TaxID=2339232 RepID=A0A3A3Z3B1_9ACTN|nr:cellulase family glycosylhydrolase [Vallicoccus soli]RJK97904.1 hypothetical protein D5H78_02755 [Vallicoccus soli]
MSPTLPRPRAVLLALALLLVVGLVPAATASAPPSAAAAAAAPPRVALGAQFHGLWADWTDAQRAKALDTLRANGVTSVRIDVGWGMIEPRRGQYDYGWGVPQVDKVLRMARERGLRVLATLWLTPSWANGGRGDKVLPTDVADYGRVARFAASRWKDVEAWQVWNEPNSAAFLSPPDPTAYTRLLKAAYPQIKAGNPAARVVFGGTEYVDTAWIDRAYQAGARSAFDVMAVHPYQGDSSAAPEHPTDGNKWWLDQTRVLLDVMRKHGDGAKHVWFTEMGWSAHANTSSTPVWARGVSEAVQADYLVRSVRYASAQFPQVTRAYWYNSRDKATGDLHQDRFGLMRRDLTAKPALRAAGCAYLGRC